MSIINRGTGAGGAATNENGKSFENITSVIPLLIKLGFTKMESKKGIKSQSYTKKDGTKEFYFFTQHALKAYMMNTLNKELFRHPDEAFLIKQDNKYTLIIIEKKTQNGPGSIDEKLSSGSYFVREYKECVGDDFDIKYCFCLNEYLKNYYTSDTPKYRVMRKLHKDDNITVLFGSDTDYFSKLQDYVGLK
jgi:hypothetical protein